MKYLCVKVGVDWIPVLKICQIFDLLIRETKCTFNSFVDLVDMQNGT